MLRKENGQTNTFMSIMLMTKKTAGYVNVGYFPQ